MYIAKRMSRLGTETAFEVLAKAKALECQGRDIVHLEIGEPDFDTPVNIREAAKRALDEGWTHYGPSAGLPENRKIISEYMKKYWDLDYTTDEIVVVPGAKPIMFYTILACVEDTDEVIYPNPGFPIYESMINYIGAKAVPIQLREELDFRLDVNELASLVNDKTRLVIINSPQNPTGGVLTPDDLKAVADLAVKHDFMVMSDEVYNRIIYDGEHHSIASLPGMKERTIIIDGFSKTYAMTGWRLGWGAMPADLAPHITRLMTNSNSCACSFAQVAGMEGLTGPQEDSAKMVEAFRQRRDVIVDGMNSLPGVTCKKPRGAFYVFPNITGTGKDEKFLADYFLNEAGVACLAGTSFGAFGKGYIRFSYANSVDNIEKAISRMGEALKSL
ncbi:MAG: pyridoxal phosphate-dependent aminotransferase [Candidatus Zixiibacteriota bacterium]|jgi:aspartate/methionine/tyrosine aminotransferase